MYVIVKNFSNVKIIKNKKNKGFAEGNDQGIKYLLDVQVNFIWVLNNDTIVDKSCLKFLLESMFNNPNIDCATGKIFYEKPKDCIWYGGGYRHSLHKSVLHLGEGKLNSDKYNIEKSVEFISGCCMFFRKNVIQELGPFIKEYIAYSEDNEFCWRAINKGYNLYYYPKAVIWHKVSASVKQNKSDLKNFNNISSFAWYLMIRNNLWTIRYHGGSFFNKSSALFFNILIELKLICSTIFNFNLKVTWSLIKATYVGLLFTLPKRKDSF